MITKDFNEVVQSQLDYCKQLLITKGQEYSLDEDRLLVFKRAAELQGESPKQALCGMMAKHIISIYDMCMSDQTFNDAKWTEKITDAMNYLLLLKAMVKEANYDEEKKT